MTTPQRNVLTFQWDPAESLGGNQYLTPVYFNRQVLVRYLYDSRFYCDFVSETYGSVGNEEFDIPFGINKYGSVLAWLGDIMKQLPQREQFYWLVENKVPEHESRSEFFDAQINVEFTEPPAVIQCLNALARFNAAFHRRYGVHLYHERSIEERVEDTRRYKRLLLNNVDDFKRFLSELNEIINENTNNGDIKRFLSQQTLTVPDGAKGNKLLEKVYTTVLQDSENLIAPFFYLYDLRLWADHSIGNEKRDTVATALGIPQADDYNAVMGALFKAIEHSCEKLEAKLTVSWQHHQAG